MNHNNIILHRLVNQQLAAPSCKTPQALVAHQGAVQAQDYAGAKWAIGLRLPQLTDADVEQAFQQGDLIRTHILRPTWHFVSPADLRWMLQISAPRVQTVNGSMYRKVGLDSAYFKRSNDALAKALEGGRQRTRQDLATELLEGGLNAAEFKLSYLMMQAELDGVICSGARQGKQFTYALLDERVPAAPPWSQEEALAELIRRYFQSRGPATLVDFVTWSGMTLTQAKAGMASVQSEFNQVKTEGKDYWFPSTPPAATDLSEANFLLPNYDEYFIGFKDRSAILDPEYTVDEGRGMLSHVIILRGKVAGSWQRSITKAKVNFHLKPFRKLNEADQLALERQMQHYARFYDSILQ